MSKSEGNFVIKKTLLYRVYLEFGLWEIKSNKLRYLILEIYFLHSLEILSRSLKLPK
jgi:cysteinyl-tRNA synthetase